MQELRRREVELASNRISAAFDRDPPPTHLRANCFGTIDLCYGFEDTQL
jgi:hypothetical protein